jgi:hypothetical protein
MLTQVDGKGVGLRISAYDFFTCMPIKECLGSLKRHTLPKYTFGALKLVSYCVRIGGGGVFASHYFKYMYMPLLVNF